MKQVIVRDENWNVVYIFDNVDDRYLDYLVKNILYGGEPGHAKYAVEIME